MRCCRPPSGRVLTRSTLRARGTPIGTASARSTCWSRSLTWPATGHWSGSRRSCTPPTCRRTGTAPPKGPGSTRSRTASRCCTGPPITSRSTSRPRCTTRCTRGAPTRSRTRDRQAASRRCQVPLTRTGFVPIPPGREPGFDHADCYLDGAGATRLYVAHTGADRVDVIDCAGDSWLGALPGHPGVAGVLVHQGAGLLFTSDRAAARVSVYRCADQTLLAPVGVGPHPNGLAYDHGRGRLFSFNLGEPVGEDCSASVVDVGKRQVIATIPLPGRPRWAVYDPATDQVYVNIRDPAQILAVGAAALTVGNAFDVPA